MRSKKLNSVKTSIWGKLTTPFQLIKRIKIEDRYINDHKIRPKYRYKVYLAPKEQANKKIKPPKGSSSAVSSK